MSEQLSLFDAAELPKTQPKRKEKRTDSVDLEGLSNYALLYTATETGKNSGIHYVMTVEDAQKWCSSDVSQGQYMGSHWAYFWTSIKNYLTCVWMGDSDVLDLTIVQDNGSWDDKLAAVGVRKIPLKDCPALFAPFGIKVKIK